MLGTLSAQHQDGEKVHGAEATDLHVINVGVAPPLRLDEPGEGVLEESHDAGDGEDDATEQAKVPEPEGTGDVGEEDGEQRGAKERIQNKGGISGTGIGGWRGGGGIRGKWCDGMGGRWRFECPPNTTQHNTTNTKRVSETYYACTLYIKPHTQRPLPPPQKTRNVLCLRIMHKNDQAKAHGGRRAEGKDHAEPSTVQEQAEDGDGEHTEG